MIINSENSIDHLKRHPLDFGDANRLPSYISLVMGNLRYYIKPPIRKEKRLF